jgi:chemotaxis protein MotB
MKRARLAGIVIFSSIALGGCHTESAWRAEVDRYNRLEVSCDARRADLDRQLAAEKARVAGLEDDLRRSSVQVEGMASTIGDRERALADYRARAAQLERIKARFELLRHKLDELTRVGIEVHVRKNRMVISLPGDVLFDTGRDTLRREGREVLEKVARVLKHDRSLGDRDYQVTGHTDDQPLKGGAFHDNWGLSLMRARAVLLHLVGPGASLPRQHWSAAGYADTDPVTAGSSKDARQRNRRCELVVVPDVEEMIDLRTVAGK